MSKALVAISGLEVEVGHRIYEGPFGGGHQSGEWVLRGLGAEQGAGSLSGPDVFSRHAVREVHGGESGEDRT